MEPENIKLGPGKLYFHTPEGPQLLGSIAEVQAIWVEDDYQTVIKAAREATFTAEVGLTPELKEAFVALGAAAACAARTMGECVQACANEFYSRLIEPLQVVLTEYNAYAWAKTAHPEWVGILNRTKKRRTRKKYRDRILRAYLEVMNRGANQRPN